MFNIDKKLILSNSKINKFNKCPRCWAMSEFEPYFSGEPGVAAKVGTMLHEAWQMHLQGEDNTRLLLWLRDEFCGDPDITRSRYSYEKVQASFLRGVADLQGYRLMRVNGKPAIETTFEISFGGNEYFDDIVYTGHIDAIVMNPDGIPITLDWKTTSKTLDKAIQTYNYSFQQIPYSMVLQSLTGQIPQSEYWIYQLMKNQNSIVKHRNTPYIKDWLHYFHTAVTAITSCVKQDFFPFVHTHEYHSLNSCVPDGIGRDITTIRERMTGNRKSLEDVLLKERSKEPDIRLKHKELFNAPTR